MPQVGEEVAGVEGVETVEQGVQPHLQVEHMLTRNVVRHLRPCRQSPAFDIHSVSYLKMLDSRFYKTHPKTSKMSGMY